MTQKNSKYKKLLKENTRNKVFLFFCLIILCVGTSSLIRNEKDSSYTENRNLVKFPHFTIGTFLKSEYQATFDSAMSDQFVLAETVKSKMNDYTKLINYNNLNKNVCDGRYVSVPGGYTIFDCSDSMITAPLKYDKEVEDNVKQKIKDVNAEATKYADVYYYFLYHSNIFDFRTNKKIYNISDAFGDNYAELTFENYEEFSKYFYKTDHHWNYEGSYKGYSDIINMLLGEDEKLMVPGELVDFNTTFQGSRSRISKIKDFNENFKAYKFNFEEHEEYINGVFAQYGHYLEYFDGKVPSFNFANHYGIFYGGDEAEVSYKFPNNKGKETLLMLGPSYTNAINTLVASHFYKTYVVDLRAYETKMGKKFSFKEYISENNIDKVLILGDFSHFKDADLGLGLEEE